MANFFLRPKAFEDLEAIWVYSYENWGEYQADNYIYDLETSLQALAMRPEKGRPCEEIRAGYQKYSVGKHIIFYRATKKGIEIVRILHQRMDPDLHF